ncbi:SAFB-like transcription modulator isoform X2 [Leptopilina boulardi]|uniref:SAFB-like transcription modulator isoform X2 n=1 Tax=Leptopilina boulardi TaxID=63433 RepID=UPI0021F641F0|nr:SAFB-like transcription modulator isoform X2 [Leptopilina boulardi]
MADAEGKRLTELRVIDLKNELERRGLDKTGNKAALLDRLSKVIADEGHNPDEYLIVPNAAVNKSGRKNSGTGVQNQEEQMDTSDIKVEISENSECVEETAPEIADEEIKTDPDKSIKDEIPEEETNKKDVTQNEIKMEIKEEDLQLKEMEDKKPQIVIKEERKISNNKELSQNTESTTTAETNGIDNEDSINLTIGEDEENLLAEETEATDRQKDGGVGERKRIQDNKKGDSKGSGRLDGSANNKDGTTGSTAGTKSKDAGEGGKSGDSINKGQKRDDKDKKSSQNSSNASSRNLWVSGLSSTTRATDLKQIFSKYGKVIGAKVVTNARTPGARCYGYVTMSTSEDASKCISHLHRTELHGRFISVEKAKGDSQQSHMRKRDSNSSKSEKPKDEKEKLKENHQETIEKKDKEEKKNESEEKEIGDKKMDAKVEDGEEKKIEKDAEKKDEKEKELDERSIKSTSKKPESEKGRRDEKRVRSFDRHKSRSRSRSREHRRRDDVLTFAKIREERDRQRLRERERLLREEERRRREDMERQREVERRQRDEAVRLDREREKLRRERERIEQEKAELLRLERERQKLEREKLERERLELKRQQMRLEESRRAPPPPTIKRTSSDRRDPRDLYAEPERKRMTTELGRRHSPERGVPERRSDIMDRVSDRRMETSPSTRYDTSRSAQDIGLKKDYKRSSEFSSRSSRPETFTDVSRGREVIVRREPLPTQTPTIDPRQVKDRYERPSAAPYSRDRDVRRSDPESHRSSRDTHGGRYNESSKPPGSNTPRDSRYVDNSRPGGWHSGPPSAKSFNSVPSGGTRDPRNETSSWSSRSSDNVNRWGNSNSMGSALRHPGPPMYQGGPMQSMGMSAPGAPTSYDRFDPYKGSMPMRKY